MEKKAYTFETCPAFRFFKLLDTKNPNWIVKDYDIDSIPSDPADPHIKQASEKITTLFFEKNHSDFLKRTLRIRLDLLELEIDNALDHDALNLERITEFKNLLKNENKRGSQEDNVGYMESVVNLSVTLSMSIDAFKITIAEYLQFGRLANKKINVFNNEERKKVQER